MIMIPPGSKIGTKNNWMRTAFPGKDVVVLASGPSLIDFDYSRLDGKIVIAVNFAIMDYKQADYLVALDRQLFSGLASEGVNVRLPERSGLNPALKVICGPSSGQMPGHNVFPFQINRIQPELNDPRFFYSQASSTLCAINFAIMGKAANIYLLGVDQKYHGDRHHNYDAHKPMQQKREEHRYTRVAAMFPAFNNVPHSSKIWQLSPPGQTAVDCFEFAKLDDKLPLKKELTPSRKTEKQSRQPEPAQEVAPQSQWPETEE
jgi:hypothetical protein